MMLAREEDLAELRGEVADLAECVERLVTLIRGVEQRLHTLERDVADAQEYTVARFQGMANQLGVVTDMVTHS